MKKLISLLLTCVMLFTISSVYATEVSSLSDSELKDLYNAICDEITSRGLRAENKKIILDQKDIQIYLNGDIRISKEYAWEKEYYLYIPIVIINNSEKNIAVTIHGTSLNGWTSEGSVSNRSVPAKKKSKSELRFKLEDTDVIDTSDFKEAEFSITVYNDDDWFGDKIVDETEPIVVYATE